MKIKISTLIIITLFCSKVYCQDPIFSQTALVPETINPGFSGFENSIYSGVMYRKQWPYLDLRVDTFYFFVNSKIDEDANHAVGGNILYQRENNTNYHYGQANLNYTYHINIVDDWYFRPAIEVGYGIKSLNFNNLVLSDQININSGTINNQSIDPSVPQENRNQDFFDFAAGFVIDKKNNKDDTDFWIGAVVKHLSRPSISFFDDRNVPLDIFYSIHANYKFKSSGNYDMYASLNYMRQSAYSRLDIGTTLKYDRFFLGVMAVTNPSKNGINNNLLTSINPLVGIEFERFRFGFSRDFNTSNIGRTDGIYEISITYLSRCLGCYDPSNPKRRK
ncbi:PorP/SprF family type IX secretion system membrane protein [Flavivirga eckloniae]|uniref:Type IX secretion system membrane protein PorP/SprF n=1 Tax=Flavivirga eckloniae TaxID=1803846 RepID=A0A2K9PWG4_9FLAO|nr:PorP/SprF family type IX secretion system membrane protein [Flavivirga eckloniae]AUP81415.1 hypothetical protein C1H87_22930 [Flavivirga eckloniae]